MELKMNHFGSFKQNRKIYQYRKKIPLMFHVFEQYVKQDLEVTTIDHELPK